MPFAPTEKIAAELAVRAHGSQARKYTGQPYIVHPAEVADIVRATNSHNEEMLAAAWLHDTLEDTKLPPSAIRDALGQRVLDLVVELTDISRKEDGNRAARKAIDREHLRAASPEAQTVKLADMISNSRTIIPYGRGFASVYLREANELADVLTKGDRFLWLWFVMVISRKAPAKWSVQYLKNCEMALT